MTLLSRMVLGAALAVGLTASNARAAEPDKLLPAEADTVVQVNIKQLLDSDIIKKYALEQIKQTLDGQDAKKLLTEIGLDPLKDIEKITVGASVATLTNIKSNDIKFLMIVRGTFDPEKLFKAAEVQSKKDADRFSMIKDGGTIIFKYQPENGENPIYGTVVDDKTVVAASDKKLIANALKAAEGNKKPPIKQELADLIKKLDEKASVYVTSIVKSKFDELKLPKNDFVDLSKLEASILKTDSVSVSVKVGTDVNLEVTLGMKDDDAAIDMQNALDDVLKQVKPLIPLASAAQPQLKPLADIVATIKTSAKNKDVIISGKVTGANIGKMIKIDGDGQ
jgi:ribosomal protein L18E